LLNNVKFQVKSLIVLTVWLSWFKFIKSWSRLYSGSFVRI